MHWIPSQVLNPEASSHCEWQSWWHVPSGRAEHDPPMPTTDLSRSQWSFGGGETRSKSILIYWIGLEDLLEDCVSFIRVILFVSNHNWSMFFWWNKVRFEFICGQNTRAFDRPSFLHFYLIGNQHKNKLGDYWAVVWFSASAQVSTKARDTICRAGNSRKCSSKNNS